MKKLLSLILAMLMLLSCTAVYAEEPAAEEAAAEAADPSEIALNGRPDEEDTHITVGNTTKVNGSFFTTQFGNNTSDIDVRSMIHGYNPIVWESQINFGTDPQVVKGMSKKTDGNGNYVYTFTLHDDLTWNDGTAITAADYVFAYLLLASPEFEGLGAETAAWRHIVGYEAYEAGETEFLEGVRLIDDYTYSVAVKAQYEPYFYELSYLSVYPYPISVLAPECKVIDSKEGAAIVDDPQIDPEHIQTILTTELLEQTVLDPETGYLSHPTLTCGPYSLVSYDAESGNVEFEINKYYKGNFEGVKPVIDTVTLVEALQETLAESLLNRDIDLANKVVSGQVINEAREVLQDKPYTFLNYARLGYGFIAEACEQGPQQFEKVRQALACLIDSDDFVRTYLRGYGLTVKGYYGIGQWMTYAVNGSYRPEDLTEEVQAQWDTLTLDQLDPYAYDADRALSLLISDGWTLNELGEPFDPEKDTVRYKKLEDETLMRLSFRYAKTKNNIAAEYIAEGLREVLPKLGAEFIETEIAFTDLLEEYYREEGERSFDIAFLATNFVSTFDPYMHFATAEDYEGAMNTSGINDAELVALAWEMHVTEPGELLEYMQKWIAFQERFNEVLPTIPIYSNIYFDIHTNALKNYHSGSEINWPTALLYAYVDEKALEEEEPAETPEEETTETQTEEGSDIIIS